MASPDEWFNENLAAYRAGTLEKYKVFDLGISPELRVKRLPRARFIMPQSVVRKATAKHGIDLAILRDLPSVLAKPLAVYNSATEPNSALYKLDLTMGGEFLVAAVEYCKHPDFGMIYLVKSIYPRRNHHFDIFEQKGLRLY